MLGGDRVPLLLGAPDLGHYDFLEEVGVLDAGMCMSDEELELA